jgi:hypothetical protein
VQTECCCAKEPGIPQVVFFGGFFPRILFNGFLVGMSLKELLANDFLLKGMLKGRGVE